MLFVCFFLLCSSSVIFVFTSEPFLTLSKRYSTWVMARLGFLISFFDTLQLYPVLILLTTCKTYYYLIFMDKTNYFFDFSTSIIIIIFVFRLTNIKFDSSVFRVSVKLTSLIDEKLDATPQSVNPRNGNRIYLMHLYFFFLCGMNNDQKNEEMNRIDLFTRFES